jgi:hypothetical protein
VAFSFVLEFSRRTLKGGEQMIVRLTVFPKDEYLIEFPTVWLPDDSPESKNALIMAVEELVMFYAGDFLKVNHPWRFEVRLLEPGEIVDIDLIRPFSEWLAQFA